MIMIKLNIYRNIKRGLTLVEVSAVIGIILIIVYKSADSIHYIAGWLKTFLSIIMPVIVGVIIAFFIYNSPFPSHKSGTETRFQANFRPSSPRCARQRKFRGVSLS